MNSSEVLDLERQIASGIMGYEVVGTEEVLRSLWHHGECRHRTERQLKVTDSDWTKPHYFAPCREIADAFKVVDKLATSGWRLELNEKLLHKKRRRGYRAVFDKLLADETTVFAMGDEMETAALAICDAARRIPKIQEEPLADGRMGS